MKATLKFDAPKIRQIEIDEKLTYKALYKTKDNEIFIMHGENKISVLGYYKVVKEFDFSKSPIICRELEDLQTTALKSQGWKPDPELIKINDKYHLIVQSNYTRQIHW